MKKVGCILILMGMILESILLWEFISVSPKMSLMSLCISSGIIAVAILIVCITIIVSEE